MFSKSPSDFSFFFLNLGKHSMNSWISSEIRFQVLLNLKNHSINQSFAMQIPLGVPSGVLQGICDKSTMDYLGSFLRKFLLHGKVSGILPLYILGIRLKIPPGIFFRKFLQGFFRKFLNGFSRNFSKNSFKQSSMVCYYNCCIRNSSRIAVKTSVPRISS